MHAEAIHSELYSRRPWQFSLRSLMFVTSVAAISAGVVRLSPILAVGLLPLIAVALVRTLQTAVRDDVEALQQGLFVTFARFLGVVVLLVAFSLATIAAACVAGGLIAVGLVATVLKLVAALMWSLVGGTWRLTYGARRRLRTLVIRLATLPVLSSSRSLAILWTARLAGRSRGLYRRC